MKHICDYGCGQKAKYQFKNGKWCCSKSQNSCPGMRRKLRVSFKEIVKLTKNTGYILVTTKEEYENNYPKKLTFICPEGHVFLSRWDSFKIGVMCPYCTLLYIGEKLRTPFEEIIKFVEDEGYILLSKEEDYKNQFSYLWFGCPEGHKFKARWDCFKAGQRCPECFNKKRRDPSQETRRRMRTSRIKDMNSKFGQVTPNYNPEGCKLIEKYGEEHGYNFQHAENGGEFYIKELGYWVDGYDKERNTVIEIDESQHFNKDRNLKRKDLERQKEITDFLGCKFIRLRI